MAELLSKLNIGAHPSCPVLSVYVQKIDKNKSKRQKYENEKTPLGPSDIQNECKTRNMGHYRDTFCRNKKTLL